VLGDDNALYQRTLQRLQDVYGLDDIEWVEHQSPLEFLRERINLKNIEEDNIAVCDLGVIVKQFLRWKKVFPRVHPFYAVKSFPDVNVVRALHLLGANYDCASKAEIELCLSVGAQPSDIIYANPAKAFKHVEYAKSRNVKMMTFDNKSELDKILSIFPDAELVLRIASNDSKSLMPFGYKFGCSYTYALELVDACKEKGGNLIGVSFHVGSGCYDASAYVDTLKNARRLFDYAIDAGFDMNLLDLGGGWPGEDDKMDFFNEIAEAITPVLDESFPSPIRLISEPGRYFCTATTTMAVQIHSKREYFAAPTVVQNPDGTISFTPAPKEIQYYVTDGAYGSFNNVIWDHANPLPVPFKEVEEDAPKLLTTFFGPTCDSLDVICKKIPFPNMEPGEWIYFENMGAYTVAAGSQFNGFERPTVFYRMFKC
jgi:diaminopimelate decarboxylase